MPRYYDLLDDTRLPGRWQLASPLDGAGNELDPWQFTDGTHLELGGVPRFPLDIVGSPLDFSWAVPVRVDGQPEPWYILNALRIIRCIDDARCWEVQYWKPEDNRPDKLGEYRAVYGMRIDPTQVGNARIFRPWGWRVALIISEDIKEAIEAAGLTGTRFVEV